MTYYSFHGKLGPTGIAYYIFEIVPGSIHAGAWAKCRLIEIKRKQSPDDKWHIIKCGSDAPYTCRFMRQPFGLKIFWNTSGTIMSQHDSEFTPSE